MSVKATWNAVVGAMTRFEKIWLGAFSAAILAVTIYFSSTGTNWSDWKSIGLNWIIAPVGALTGVICVLLVARASIYNYSFGLVQSFLYGTISWASGYYGDWILNWFFFVPTQFLIYLFWRKNIGVHGPDIVRIAHFRPWQTMFAVLASLLALIGFGLVLSET